MKGDHRMEYPENVKYSEEHVWVRLDGKRAVLGLTDFYQEELDNIVPRPGEELQAGEPFGSVESIKTVTELTSPLSGRVLEANRAVQDMPGKINLEPYNSWLIVLECSNLSERDNLWTAERYKEAYPDKSPDME